MYFGDIQEISVVYRKVVLLPVLPELEPTMYKYIQRLQRCLIIGYRYLARQVPRHLFFTYSQHFLFPFCYEFSLRTSPSALRCYTEPHNSPNRLTSCR